MPKGANKKTQAGGPSGKETINRNARRMLEQVEEVGEMKKPKPMATKPKKKPY